ncbi:hypothetical protein NE237_022962 [Protea cynaroides]|uniref:RNase H type-1 domain-containing protein n=1 Tax=Protea cynaroides TaxID=273540 RepID=A0A9Q0HE10_9MAGN|nr:hypothetical protein NE237_022962 [Protea cynaroides]
MRISPFVSSFSQWLQSWAHLFTSSKKTARTDWSQVSFLCWHIWLSRNELYFHDKHWSPIDVIDKASKAFEEFSTVCSLSMENSNIKSVHFLSPKLSNTKLNADVAFSAEHRSGCVGFICKDINGSPLFVASRNILAFTVLMGEALVVQEGLQVAIENGITNLEVESDNADLISYLNGSVSYSPSSLHFVLEDILYLGKQCNASFKLISSRDAN